MCLSFDWNHLFASLNSELSFAQQFRYPITEYSVYTIQQLTTRLDLVQPLTIPGEQPWEFHSAKKHENIVELNTVHKRRITGFIRSVLLTAAEIDDHIH
jgi:hypothetical protein